MCFGFSAFGEAAGGFNNDFYAKFAPGQFSRVGLCQNFNFFAVNYKVIAFGSNVMVKSAMDGVIFQKVCKGCCIGKVVYGNNLNLGIVECSTENIAADTAIRPKPLIPTFVIIKSSFKIYKVYCLHQSA